MSLSIVISSAYVLHLFMEQSHPRFDGAIRMVLDVVLDNKC